jgi:hypothetical protein
LFTLAAVIKLPLLFIKTIVMKRTLFILVLILLTTDNTSGQNTWFNVSSGWGGTVSLIYKDSIIIFSNGEGRWNNRAIHANYHDYYTGKLIKSDTLDYNFLSEDTTIVNNTLEFYPSAILDTNSGRYQIGFSYEDKVGSYYKARAAIFNNQPFEKRVINLNVDTFSTYVFTCSRINDINYAIVTGILPSSQSSTFSCWKLLKWNEDEKVEILKEQINNRSCPECHHPIFEKVHGDNQSNENLFLQILDQWNFAGIALCFQADVIKLDTNGNTIWKCRPNDKDSFNTLDFQMVQKPNGNILCVWNDKYYAQLDPLRNWVDFNPNGTIWFAEIDYHTGKVLWRKNIRKFLEWRMMPHYTNDPDLKNSQSLYITDVQLTVDGNIVWGGPRYINYPDPDNGWKFFPALLKTDLEANPIWYREFDLFPDDKGDKGMKMRSFTQTKDNGFILTGHYENRFGEFSGGEYWFKSAILKLDSYGCLVPGCHATDNVVEISNPKGLCLVYPNPARNEFYIQYPPELERDTKIQLSDLHGRIVFQSTTQQNTINTENLPSGIYFLQIKNLNNDHYETHKIIISR